MARRGDEERQDGELVDRVPAEPHDRPVSAVALPSQGIVSVSGLLRR